ncbi:MAG: 30S ribosome-binding factor RbfA [Chloroflexota bacterium]|nr:30S ribosome-binding factor RbfA [Chloroflexota bacterium]
MAHKQARVAGRIRKILSTLVVREVADPRLQGITVTDVVIDAELMYAKVFVNALGEEERAPEVLAALEHAKGFLRREVAHRVGLRRAPVLTFKWDDTLERSERINALLTDLDIPAPLPEDEQTSLAALALASLEDEDEFSEDGDDDYAEDDEEDDEENLTDEDDADEKDDSDDDA